MEAHTLDRVDELVVQLRRGHDLPGLVNPAGPLFSDRYREHEITMTGGGCSLNDSGVLFTVYMSVFDPACPTEDCC